MCACICPSRFVLAITPTFMNRFQNYLTQLLSLWRRSASETFLHVGRLKVNVTLESPIHVNQVVRAITPTFMHGFQNNFVQAFSLRSSSAI